MTVQHSSYRRFSESLRPALASMLGGLEKQFTPQAVRRMGLRYVNRLVDPEAKVASAWQGRIRPAALGILDDPVLADKVQGTQYQTQLDLEDAAGAIVRHGAFADAAVHGAYSYLVDIDVYSQATDHFDVDRILAMFRKLNVTALSLFQWFTTDDWRATMGPRPRDERPAGPKGEASTRADDAP
jgi:uncharacterized protein (TIGR04255 family)